MNKLLTDQIQLNWLRTFNTAGNRLNFTEAAIDLNMSQSAVSQQIQLLEHHLGHQLFTRVGRSIQLTDSGRAFLPLVNDMLSQLNIGATQIFSPNNEAVVDVSVNTAFGILWLAPRLQHFNAIYPQISIRQQGTNWATDFAISTSELEIRYGSGTWPGFKTYQLTSHKLRPYCSLSNARRIREPADIKNLPLIDVMGTPQSWDNWLEFMDIKKDSALPRQFVDSYANAVAMAADGLGICLVYDELVEQGIYAKRLVAPSVNSVKSENSYYLCCKQDKELSHASHLFRDWLLSTVKHNPIS